MKLIVTALTALAFTVAPLAAQQAQDPTAAADAATRTMGDEVASFGQTFGEYTPLVIVGAAGLAGIVAIVVLSDDDSTPSTSSTTPE